MMRRAQLLPAVLVAACMSDPGAPAAGPPPLPLLVRGSVAPNPDNVLSAVVAVTARDADSARVLYRLTGAGGDSSTPAVRLLGDTARIPVLGLLPDLHYALRVQLFGPGGVMTGDTLPLATDSLPDGLPLFTAGGPDPSPGFVVFGWGAYGVVIDNTGRVVWYHRFAVSPGLSFQAQPVGRYVTRPPTPAVGDLEPWVEIDPLGVERRQLGCVGGLQPRLHDLILRPDDSYWIMCDETRVMDLTPWGGMAAARVTGTDLQHVAEDGTLLFAWSPFDHFAITDVDPVERLGANVNWTHGNAMDLDGDTSVLISFRNLNEITKIDTRTGAVLWRLGGLRNQFVMTGATRPFLHQHGLRGDRGGMLMLLDNLGDSTASRAERYAVDESARVAHLERQFESAPTVITPIGGSVQLLPGGRTLVSFGVAGRVEEYGPDGSVLWQINGNAGYVFRAQRIQSLYQPGVGSSR